MSTINSAKPVSAETTGPVQDLEKTGIHPDHWYPLVRSRDVKPGKASGRIFAGGPIVVRDLLIRKGIPLSG